MKNFGNCLTKALKEKEITKRELSIRLNLPEQNIGRWANGIRIPRLDTFLKICQCLEMTPNELLEIGE